MISLLRPCLVLFAAFSVLTGLLYPAVVTGIAQAVFPQQANGSLIVEDGAVVGSALIGQEFDEPKYFWGRPSATAPVPYNAAASTGSNQGPLNPALQEAVRARIDALRTADPPNMRSPVPIDLVTASASGLDPHVSPAAAYYQVARVARARGVPEDAVRKIVTNHVERPLLGEPVVNVLRLNLDLDEKAPRMAGS
jgi:potassium-transporting ATPase KdpC subunit